MGAEIGDEGIGDIVGHAHQPIIAAGAAILDGEPQEPGPSIGHLEIRIGHQRPALGSDPADIETLALQCRFRDCRHHDEPGCAVREGVADDRLRNYHKLLREARRDTMSALERQQQLAMWKARGRAAKVNMKAKRG